MFTKLFGRISRRISEKHDRPNRNENGLVEFLEEYATYYDVLEDRDVM